MVALSLLACLTSCNAKDDGRDDTDNYVTTQTVAVTAFSLTADLRVMKNLDSVYFSIDLEHGVIFNADSLPKGTNITKLIPKITYPSSVTAATIEMTGGTHREDGSVNYLTNPNDTIDFTGNVTLTLSAGSNISKTYSLKVNVHQEDPDTLFWENTATSTLPSRMANPRNQKTVAWKDGAYCLIQESDGTYTGAYCANLFDGDWTKTALSTFKSNVSTLAVDNNGTLYTLSSTSELLTSTDGKTWNGTDVEWDGIIGPYGDVLLGYTSSGNTRTTASYPSGKVNPVELPSDFPYSGFSTPVEYSNRWTPNPTIVIFGGDNLTSANAASWAFDGSSWVDIADAPLPALSGLAVIPYFAYLNNASNGILREFDALLAFGGTTADGKVNNTVYVSYNHGINWQKAPEYMQLPEGITAGTELSALAFASKMQSNLSDRWKQLRSNPRRVNFEIDGDLIIWECPYIFLFGGKDASGKLNDKIRCGVLRRLTFTPLF